MQTPSSTRKRKDIESSTPSPATSGGGILTRLSNYFKRRRTSVTPPPPPASNAKNAAASFTSAALGGGQGTTTSFRSGIPSALRKKPPKSSPYSALASRTATPTIVSSSPYRNSNTHIANLKKTYQPSPYKSQSVRFATSSFSNGVDDSPLDIVTPPKTTTARANIDTNGFAFARKIDLKVPDNFFGTNRDSIFPTPNSVMDLSFLREALEPESGGEEFFIPRRIFVREEMETAAREIREKGRYARSVLSGSPGIGKSIVCFLITLYSVWKDGINAVYLRDVEDEKELMSVFAMSRSKNGSINIRYSREVDSNDRFQIYWQLRGSFQGISKKSREIFAVLDGPKADTYQPYKKLTIGCTSGAGIKLKNEMTRTFNVVMGAWREETLRLAVVALLELDETVDDERNNLWFNVDKFEEVYFVLGGRIRKFCASYLGTIDT